MAPLTVLEELTGEVSSFLSLALDPHPLLNDLHSAAHAEVELGDCSLLLLDDVFDLVSELLDVILLPFDAGGDLFEVLGTSSVFLLHLEVVWPLLFIGHAAKLVVAVRPNLGLSC